MKPVVNTGVVALGTVQVMPVISWLFSTVFKITVPDEVVALIATGVVSGMHYAGLLVQQAVSGQPADALGMLTDALKKMPPVYVQPVQGQQAQVQKDPTAPVALTQAQIDAENTRLQTQSAQGAQQ